MKILWDRTIQTARTVEHNRPDIILIEKKENKWLLIDVAVPCDFNIVKTEEWKVEKYQDLAFEISRMYRVETKVIPIVIGAFGTVPKRLKKSIDGLKITNFISSTQMTVILETAGILRRAMNF